MTDEWWKSKTKRGAVLVAIGTIIKTIGMVEKGEIDLFIGIPLIIAEIGILSTIFGYRNAIDKKK